MAGINPITPGYSKLQVLPKPGHLNKIITSNGAIEVKYDKESWQFLFELYIPNSSAAIVRM